MQIVPPRYLGTTPGRHAIIDALAPAMQSWFADTITEPIPEELVAILRRMDTYGSKSAFSRHGGRVTSKLRRSASASIDNRDHLAENEINLV